MAHATKPLLAGCTRPPCVLFLPRPPQPPLIRLPAWLRPTAEGHEGPGPAPQDEGERPPSLDLRRLADHLSTSFHRLYIPALQGLARRTLGERGRLRVDATWPGGFLARIEADHHHAWRPTDDHLVSVQGTVYGPGPLLVMPQPVATAGGAAPSAHARLQAAQAWAQVPRWAWDGPEPDSFVWP